MDDFHIPSSLTCHDLTTCRTFWDIIYTCLATLIACIWVSIHPNVPGWKDGDFKIFWRRLQLMLLDLIAPEIIILWSIRQWVVARRLSKDFGISKTHGFFISMGGFVVKTNIGRYRPVKPAMVRDFLPAIAGIHARDIQDKSKADWFSKFITFFQISFFVASSFGRTWQKLQITELELCVLAFSVVHIATYLVWWSKPLRVDRPIVLANYIVDDPPKPWKPYRNIFVRMVKGLEHSGRTILGTTSLEDHAESDAKVPLLWAGRVEGTSLLGAAAIAALLAVSFGGVHALAWNYPFPSKIEQGLWRLACIILVLVPVFVVFLYALLLMEFLPSHGFFEGVYRILLAICAVGYVAARLVLLGLPVAALRALPEGAFRTVEWTQFIPHI